MFLTFWVGLDSLPLPGDAWLTRRVQEAPGLDDVAGIVNAAGLWQLQSAVMAVVAVVAWFHPHARRRRREVLFSLAAVVLLRFWSQLLKALVQSPRPSEDTGVRVDYLRDTYGFPSGHVYGDVLVYGTIAICATAFLGKRPAAAVRVAAAVIILLAGPARVYVGAHWPSDVLGGYLWGVAGTCLAVVFGRWAAKQRR